MISFWDKWNNFKKHAATRSDRSYMFTLFPPNYFDFFIDIGAQRGWVSKEFAERNNQTKILSYEPVVSEFSLMTERIKPFPNITAFNLALGNGEDFYWLKRNSGWHMFVPKDDKSPHSKRLRYPIQSKTLTQIYQDNNINSDEHKVFLKIDCEGAERFLMNESDESIMKKCHHVAMEIHFTSEKTNDSLYEYYQPNWTEYVQWVNETFPETHNVLYHKSKKTQGLGTYVLTRKDLPNF